MPEKNNRESIRAYVLVKSNFNDLFLDNIVDEAMKILLTDGIVTIDQVDAIINTYYPPVRFDEFINEWHL